MRLPVASWASLERPICKTKKLVITASFRLSVLVAILKPRDVETRGANAFKKNLLPEDNEIASLLLQKALPEKALLLLLGGISLESSISWQRGVGNGTQRAN